ncbi:TonB-dependent vitamin B12 receptor [Salinisphaera sp. T31B1]|uniref:TonB-dependent vitamin B12 receptor n=1 Tax=Salinisphaera sp. T31B1 TaxID=727963 RepID=UPI00333FA7BC
MNSRFLVGAGLIGVGLSGHAAQPVPANSLAGIQVTANRTSEAPSRSLAATTVIDRAEIERLQARSVSDLLRRSPGITVTNSGGPGKAESIFMRGTESDHVLVLVDGVEYGSATTGQPAIQDLPVDQIERIEIVRGPRSSLYGSEAIGGVIQIFTRDGSGTRGTRPYASIGAGSYDSYQAQAGLSGSDARSHYNISVSGYQTHGFDSCRSGAANTGGCFTDEPDDDGYDRVSGALNFGHRFDNGVDFKLNFLRTQGNNEYDGSPFSSNRADVVQQVLGTSVAFRPLEAWQLTLSGGTSWDDSDNYYDGAPAGRFETRRNQASIKNDISIGDNSLITAGVDYHDDNVSSDTVFAETSRDNTGAFIQYLGDWGRHHVQLAGRGDDNQQFGDHATGSASYGFDLTEAYTASISYGTAFKAPTFNELYFPDYGNPDLDPEESRSVELGLDATQRWGTWSLHAFETHIDDLIASDPATFTAVNVNEARIRGLEAGLGTAIAQWQISTQLTWLSAENRSEGANRGNDLARRPQYSAQFDVDRTIAERFSVGAGLFLSDSAYDDAANANELDSYQLLDLRGSMNVSRDWQLQAELNNVFDEDYETVRFYNQPGRNVFVTLRYRPQ